MNKLFLTNIGCLKEQEIFENKYLDAKRIDYLSDIPSQSNGFKYDLLLIGLGGVLHQSYDN